MALRRACTSSVCRARHRGQSTCLHSLVAGQGVPVFPQSTGVFPSKTVEKWIGSREDEQSAAMDTRCSMVLPVPLGETRS